MKSQSFAPSFLLLLLAAPAWGQSPPLPAGSGVQRPLNLSLPRDVISKQGSIIVSEPEDTATRNLRQEEQQKETRAERRPYGTGFEARQRGMLSEGSPGFASGGSGAGAAGGGGGGGGGGAGRGGGMGRGR
jgi:hypothetical protein